MRKLIILFIVPLLLITACPAHGQVEKPYSDNIEKLLENYRSHYRLSPDNRFLLAVEEINYFFSGQKKEKADATYNDGQWTIAHNGKNVGSIPEYPDFSHFMEVLEQYALSLASQYPLNHSLNDQYQSRNIKNLLDSFLVENVIEALRRINLAWEQGSRSEDLFLDASRGLVLLFFQSLDKMGHNDGLAARALAMLAITRAVIKEKPVRAEALLAAAMDYTGQARKISAALKTDDPIRLYVEKDFLGLKKLCLDRSKNAEARLLLLGLAAERKDVAFLQDTLDTFVSQEEKGSWVVAKYFMDLNSFDFNKDFPLYLENQMIHFIKALYLDLKKETKTVFSRNSPLLRHVQIQLIDTARQLLISRRKSPIDTFYFSLERLSRFYGGFFIDAELIHDYYESFFLSCLYVNGLFFMDSLGSVEASRTFADHFKNVRNETGRDFGRWYGTLSQSESASRNVDDLIANLAGLSSLGGAAAHRTFEEIEKHLAIKDPKCLKAMYLFGRRLDSRPDYRFLYGGSVFDKLYDLSLTEKLITTGTTVDPTRYFWLIFSAEMQMDSALLLQYAASRDFPLYQRGRALERLENMTKDSGVVLPALGQLSAEFPDDYALTKQYLKALRQNRQYEEARQIAQKWLDKDLPTSGLQRLFIQNEVARAYYDQGLYREGLDYILPLVEGQQAGTIVIAAQLYDKLGQYKNAEETYRAALDRYPSQVWILIEYAKFLWARERYEEAAALFKSFRYPLKSSAWAFEISPVFCEIFNPENRDKGEKAFQALIDAGLPPMDIGQIPGQVNRRQDPELAYRLSSRLPAPNGFHQIIRTVDTYKYLKNYKGKSEALAFIAKKFPASQLNMASMVFFSEHQYELLWDLNKNPGKGAHPEYVWLLRAAAWASGYNDQEIKRKLIEYYTRNTEGQYNKLGRYLMDLESTDGLWPFMEKDDARCEITFFIGLKEEQSGRFSQASDWYHVAMDTGLHKEGEYIWSIDKLFTWYCEGVYLDKLPEKLAAKEVEVAHKD